LQRHPKRRTAADSLTLEDSRQEESPIALKAYIFDLNGTLLDDFTHNIQAFQMIFKEFGLEIPDPRIEKLMGKPTPIIIGTVMEENGIQADFRALALKKVDYYIQVTEGRDIFFPETEEVVQSLKKDYRIGIFTGTTRKQISILGDFLNSFDLVVAGEEAIKPKPAPDTLLFMAEKMGFDPGDCSYVGDMPQDMITSKNAGMKGIGLENRMYSGEELIEAGAVKVISNLREIQGLDL